MTHSELTTAIAAYTNATEDKKLSTLTELCRVYEARINYLIQKEKELRGKPQFLIEDDDDYQDQLERQWARQEICEEYNDLIEEHQERLAQLEKLKEENLPPLSTEVFKGDKDMFFPTNKRVERGYENGKVGEQLWIQMTSDGIIVQNYWTKLEILRGIGYYCKTVDLNKL